MTEKAKGSPDSMFAGELYPEKVLTLAGDLYSQLIAKQLIDLPGSAAKSEHSVENLRQQHERRFIARISTLKHTDVKEIGAEHLCHETIKKLRIGEFLQRQGFSEEEASLAVTQIAIRATHPASELATARWIKNNSDIMLTQKSVTSEAMNLQDEPIHLEQCSEATPEAGEIYDKVGIPHEPYKPKKTVWAQIRNQKIEPPNDDRVT